MYKIIVCDDERSILERLISLINKLSDDFEVIGVIGIRMERLLQMILK